MVKIKQGGEQGVRTICRRLIFSVMPEGFYRAYRQTRDRFPLTTCGNVAMKKDCFASPSILI